MNEAKDRGGKDRASRGRKLPVAGQPLTPGEESPPPGEPLASAGREAAGEPQATGQPPAGTTGADEPLASEAAPLASEAAPPAGIEEREVPSWRLILTLALAGALAGLAIVVVFGWAQPRIEAHRAAALRAAIQEVLGGPARYETLFVVEGELASSLPPGLDSAGLDRIYAGYASDGRSMGFAIAGEKPGYQDIVGLIFGYDAAGDELLGMKVLESKETPGLGDRIEKDSGFVSAFRGVVPPIEGVKAGAGTGTEHEVDMITGATISSRTVIEIINQRLEAVGPLIQAYEEKNRTPSEPAESAEADG